MAGCNNAGQIVGWFLNDGTTLHGPCCSTDVTGLHSFLYTAGTFTQIDVPEDALRLFCGTELCNYQLYPGNLGVAASGINNLGQIVGNVEVIVNTPEPSTWLLLGSGLVGLIRWRKRQRIVNVQ